MLKRASAGLAAGLLLTAVSAQAAIVNAVFTIDSASIVDLYSATFDGPLNPSCAGAPDPAECAFFSGQTPAGRAISISSAPANTASGTLDVLYDNATGAITQINDMVINLPDATLTIAGDTIVTVTQGNGVPTANDTLFIHSGTGAPNGTADANQSTLGPGIFEHDDAPKSDAPDFATFTDIVDSCTGSFCALIPVLSLDGTRYRVLGTVNGAGGDTLQLQAQTGNNSIYKVDFTTAAAVIPVPAAVWLFGSALGLLGWVRRRAA